MMETDAPIQTDVVDFLRALAKAVKLMRFYPRTNPMGDRAARECWECFQNLKLSDSFTLGVSAHWFYLNDSPVDTHYPGISQLARQLYLLHVESLTFDPQLTEAELVRFGRVLARDPRNEAERIGMSRILEDGDVTHVTVIASQLPQIMEADQNVERMLVQVIGRREQGLQRRLVQTSQEPVRSQPARALKVNVNLDLSQLSAEELGRLADGPRELSELLGQIVAGEGATSSWGCEAEHQLRRIRQLLESKQEGERAEVMGRLARTIQDLEPQERERLVRESLLPALQDGREEGTLLRFFPDVDLAEALSVLEESGVGFPQAMDRSLRNLHLPERRRIMVLSLLERQAEKQADREGAPSTSDQEWLQETGGDELGAEMVLEDDQRTLVLPASADSSIAVTAEDRESLARWRAALEAYDPRERELKLLFNLLVLESKDEIQRDFTARVRVLLEELLENERWDQLAQWVERLQAFNREAAGEAGVPSLSVISEMLAELSQSCVVPRAVDYCCEADAPTREPCVRVLRALGSHVIAPFVAVLDEEENRSARRTVLNLMLELLHQHGDLLSSYLSHNHWYVVRNLVWVLGRLGPGAEPAVAQALNYEHPQVRREAVRSLSLLGTSAATQQLVLLLESGDRELRRMVAEQLPSVPSEIMLAHLRDLLDSRSFVQRDAYVTRQCIDLLGRLRGSEAEELLGRLRRFRFSLWNWRLLRAGWAAHAMLRTHRGRGA